MEPCIGIRFDSARPKTREKERTHGKGTKRKRRRGREADPAPGHQRTAGRERAQAGAEVPDPGREGVSPRRHRSGRHGVARGGGQAGRQGGAAARHRGPRRAAGHALRAGSLGRAPDLPGDGRRRQGRRHQARHVRRQPAGLPGRTRSRRRRPRIWTTTSSGAAPSTCPSAAASGSSTAPTTRRSSSCASTRSSSRSRSCPQELVSKDIWDDRFHDIRSFERYLDAQRHARAQVLPARLAEGAEAAVPRADREPREELEVLGDRRAGARATGRTTCAPTRT